MRWLVLIGCLPACVFFFDDNHECQTPAIAAVQQRDPQTLRCESYGSTCDPACGDCVQTGAPQPSWGICGSTCEQLGESACATDPTCRVIEDADCAINRSCLTNFLGCFPVDMSADSSIDCWKADSWSCSRSNACTALHRATGCADASCDRPFELCAPEGSAPGRCWDPVVCDAAPPACPSGTTPGVSNGCYTSGCIPLEICEPQAL